MNTRQRIGAFIGLTALICLLGIALSALVSLLP